MYGKSTKARHSESGMGPKHDMAATGSSPGVKAGKIPNASWKGAGANVVESKLNKGDDSNRRGRK